MVRVHICFHRTLELTSTVSFRYALLRISSIQSEAALRPHVMDERPIVKMARAITLPPNIHAELRDVNPALHDIVSRWLKRHGKVQSDFPLG